MNRTAVWMAAAIFAGAAAGLAGQEEAALVQKYKLLESGVVKAGKLLEQGKIERCEAEIARCLAAIPDHHAALYLRAQALYRSGDYAGALAAMESAKAGFRRMDEAVKKLQAAKLGNDMAKAQALIDNEPGLEARAAQTKCMEAYYGGDVINNIGQINKKSEDVKQGLIMAKESSPAEYHFFTGNCQFKLGIRAEAEASYRAALDAEPDHAGAAGNLINLLFVQGRVSEAREALERAEARKIAIHPGLSQAVRGASK
jgi:tetratricopeptide (TPR) repeat protein